MTEHLIAERYIGLMSGTSLDGVDGVIADFSGAHMKVLAHAHLPFAAHVREAFMALQRAGDDELNRAAHAGHALVQVYGGVVSLLLAQTGLSAADIRAIGAHGQTVRHRPGDELPYTVQVNAPAALAELAGIDVVADFRSRDIAAGGQGAPLVPAFHRAVFGLVDRAGAVLNIGGISNLTAWSAHDGHTIGFDCGPGNALMDHWCQRHCHRPFDAGGAWAASGRVEASLLTSMRADPYFALTPPKSTGRDLFNPEWLDDQLSRVGHALRPEDVQATLCELTAQACADSVDRHAAAAPEVVVCGGGAFNDQLMGRLAALLPRRKVVRSDDRGLPASEVEAAAFAWLARAHVRREPGNLVSVTGARGPRVLGALYPK
ncbi:anhydro-N-acetylmuramic acid kinase [Rhizobacter sp. OV335]|uniref:anhydro-N-acetylmuramic acid kinase n=1 Tax=Rhizobacter sp. OV335 TaxID=1500264 RepID=UPI00091F3FCF|nr:anhydro-N-acetylmuramic acid kinase [Rhizobacter sp. OV335]SHM21867.1 anhydro-N-acetylmuramic acid kinase [Rhizobacter sp. OV335]